MTKLYAKNGGFTLSRSPEWKGHAERPRLKPFIASRSDRDALQIETTLAKSGREEELARRKSAESGRTAPKTSAICGTIPFARAAGPGVRIRGAAELARGEPATGRHPRRRAANAVRAGVPVADENELG